MVNESGNSGGRTPSRPAMRIFPNLPVSLPPCSARNYYMAVLTMLALERTQFPVSPRSFITSGEREDGTQFYWDASMQATACALLEPAGMKATLRRWLVQNARSGLVINISEATGYDAQRHDRITGYAFNAYDLQGNG